MNKGARRIEHAPGLDGLRGVAILLVLVGHAQVAGTPAAGMVGVTVFFTLSGFLITALLLQEKGQDGSIRLRDFFARRVRRLAPALVVFLTVIGLISWWTESGVFPTGHDILGAALYVGNYTSAAAGHESIILHTWSLCVEEQFYAVWPLVIAAFVSPTRLRRCAVGLLLMIVLCAAARLLAWDDGSGQLRVNYATEMRADALLVGCLTALHVRSGRTRARGTSCTVPALIVLLCLIPAQGALAYVVTPTVVPWLTAVLIVAVWGGRATWLTPAWLQLMGRRSYGLYLWHFPLFTFAIALQGRYQALVWVVVLLLTAAIVHLSWRCVEEPFLRSRQPGQRGRSSVSPRIATETRENARRLAGPPEPV